MLPNPTHKDPPETRLIPLTQGKFALVDAADESLNRYQWYYHNAGYAARDGVIDGRRKIILMHRVVAGTPSGFRTDHKNGDRLDNRRANLRVCNSSENATNSKHRTNNKSGFKGVVFHKVAMKFMASIMINKRSLYLGLFESAESAHAAYCAAALLYHGKFANPATPTK